MGSCGRSDRKAGVCFIFVVSDALFHLQVNISLLCWTKLQGSGSLGCVIALERYSGVD
jgi:hypothetical protein